MFYLGNHIFYTLGNMLSASFDYRKHIYFIVMFEFDNNRLVNLILISRWLFYNLTPSGLPRVVLFI